MKNRELRQSRRKNFQIFDGFFVSSLLKLDLPRLFDLVEQLLSERNPYRRKRRIRIQEEGNIEKPKNQMHLQYENEDTHEVMLKFQDIDLLEMVRRNKTWQRILRIF